MENKREEFINAMLNIAEYWKDKKNSSFGAVFSVLVLLDGCDSQNNFQKIELKGISNNRELHTEFCERRANNGKTN